MRTAIQNKVLCNKMNKMGESEIISVGTADELSVSLTFSPDATDVSISFWISIDSMNWHKIEGTKANDGSLFMTSTSEPQLYSFDVSMGTSFKLVLEKIASGSVCAYATSFSVS